MGANIVTMLLDDETRPWLEESGFELDETSSRWPTLSELRGVLDALPDCKVDYRVNPRGGYDIEIVRRDPEPRYATIWTEPFIADDAPLELGFHKSDERMFIEILVKLARTCGPFVWIDASDGEPNLVRAAP